MDDIIFNNNNSGGGKEHQHFEIVKRNKSIYRSIGAITFSYYLIRFDHVELINEQEDNKYGI